MDAENMTMNSIQHIADCLGCQIPDDEEIASLERYAQKLRAKVNKVKNGELKELIRVQKIDLECFIAVQKQCLAEQQRLRETAGRVKPKKRVQIQVQTETEKAEESQSGQALTEARASLNAGQEDPIAVRKQKPNIYEYPLSFGKRPDSTSLPNMTKAKTSENRPGEVQSEDLKAREDEAETIKKCFKYATALFNSNPALFKKGEDSEKKD